MASVGYATGYVRAEAVAGFLINCGFGDGPDEGEGEEEEDGEDGGDGRVVHCVFERGSERAGKETSSDEGRKWQGRIDVYLLVC